MAKPKPDRDAMLKLGHQPMSALKAIRTYCLDCCCGSSNEVKHCRIVKCPLYPWRFGSHPWVDRSGSSGNLPGKK
jgi:hypothetical protein